MPGELVRDCPRLHGLCLADDLLTSVPVELVSNCSMLEYLNLHNNQLTTLPWVQLNLLRCLQELNIMHNPLRDEAPLSLQKAIRQAEQTYRVRALKAQLEAKTGINK